MEREPKPTASTSTPATDGDCFGLAETKQNNPEFTMRNINRLLTHPMPIPQGKYSIIRAREVFDRVENYKSFLNDVRL